MWILTAAAAFGGAVYVNGTVVEPRSLADITLDKASVRFDAQGNIHIDAPGFQLSGAPVVPNPRPPTIGPASATVPTYGRWWLVSEDNNTRGHTVEVWINNQLAITLRSGDGPKLIEISKWLRLGTNHVVVKSSSTNASGGIFAVYLGAGGSTSGAFDMPDPAVTFEIGSSRSGPYQRDYTLTVDR